MADQERQQFFGENRSLFSDYYLRERLRELAEWEQDISEPFQQALQIYQDKKSVLSGMNEAQTENEFVQPVLEQVLGFRFDVQKAEKKQGRTNIPDYIFFPDEESLKTAQQNRDSDSYYNEAVALGDAKYWERPLDSKGIAEKDLYTNANPSFQIVNYLTVTGLEWGILTNGSRWRLYSTKARSRIDSYFEIDLKRILEEEDPEQFKYFYHFFRSEAFKKDPKTGGSFLERIFEESIDYGSRLEKQLKDLIFEDVFLLMSRGFVEYRKEETEIEKETDESLDEIYQGTLRLLYRLLFLLHAESRGLLPLDNRGYLQYSLMELRKDIANRIDQDLPQSMRSFDVWNDLDSLFHIIDLGDPDLNVPRYNGGLFRQDHPNNRFLKEHKIADKYLVPALELLTRETKPNESGHKPFIDYKSLNVEQLGSIYEGLLEFHLRQSDNDEDGSRELFLENDKGERKATGSYYTPHYIVEYIVEHTLGPVFEERAGTFKNLMDDLLPKYEKYTELDEKIAGGDRSEQIHNKRKALNLEIASLERNATEALLSLKICDPAMGSGHFLKEATDKLAEKIITLLAEYPINPVTNLLEEIRSQILQSLEEQEITIDAEEHLKDTNLIKRMVMKRCIYGVDLNPMAVELAKLSLWLDSFTVGAPLSFLDHHLKTGNSLIGTTVGEIRKQLETGQSHMFGGPFSGLLNATELMREVSVKTDATYSEVEQSIERYHDFEEAVKPYKKVLDIWLSRHFDNERAGDFLMTFSDQITHLLKGETVDLGEKQQTIIDNAEQLTNEKYFFHWELEFPEVFVDLKQAKWLENPGFDAVVGNPPYGSIDEEFDKYFRSNFTVSSYFLDLFHLFIEKGVEITTDLGRFGQILPEPWLTMENTKALREFILNETRIDEIVQFKRPVFEEATVDNIVIVVEKNKDSGTDSFNVYVADNNKKEINDINLKNSITQNDLKQYPNSRIEIRLSSEEQELYKTIQENSISLAELSKISIGIQAYNSSKHTKEQIENRAFHSDHKKDESYYPELNGSDVSRYSLDTENNSWIKYGDHLHDYRPFEYFSEPRILVREITSGKEHKIHSVYTDEVYCNYKTILNILSGNGKVSLHYLLALLNSKLTSWIFPLSSNKLVSDTFPRISVADLKELPIREIDFSNFNTDKNAQYLGQLEEHYQEYLEKASAVELLNVVEDLINGNEEYRLPVIHDFLAELAEKMLEFNKEKQHLKYALDPFKFLNKGVAFKSFSDVFADAIKYGDQLTDEVDIGSIHHDIEGLRLRPLNRSDRLERSDLSERAPWLLSVHLKHRDPETGWDDWIKEEGNIVRSTPDIYRFELSDEQARYWQQSFEVLDEFENSGTFPGGKTRSTFEKLMKSEVPVFDDSGKVDDLIDLREKLAEIKKKIEKTDWLIDQVVYQLYGLSEEEIEVVEGSV